MPSILSNNQQTMQQDIFVNAKNLANEILSTPNPQETFNQLLNSNESMKSGMDLINQYGNGDPKAAFFNYMNSNGKQSVGQVILQGLKNIGIG